ncbi:MAG: AI-2E family transporter [Pilosibacter sp.]
MDRSVSALRVAVAGIVLFFIYFVAVLLTLQEMDDIREKRSRSAFRREFLVVGERIASVVSAWLKTQAFILFLTSAVCIFGLAVIGNPYSFLFGCGIGILDALPVLGAGTVLIPWGVVLLFQKAWKKGCGDLWHLCGLLLSASDLRGETDGEAGGAFAAGIAGIHVCGT